MSGTRPLRVLHMITRMIVGGAQENTLISCAAIDRARFPSDLLTGPETGLEGQLLSEVEASGVPMFVEPSLVRDPHPFKDLMALIGLIRFLRRRRYDVVHTHTAKVGVLGRIAARLARVPVIIHTAHGWGFNPEQSKTEFHFWAGLERFCARFSDAVVVVATPDREEGLALGIGTPEKYALIRSGIELETFRDVAVGRSEMRARLGLPADAFVIGSVGRLSAQKAPLDLVAAFERVAAERPEAWLVLVGDGSLRGEVEARVRESGLEQRVRLLGVRRDVPELLRAFDVLALSSRWEGLPRVFPQAMAARLPIVATRVDGAIDAIRPGENGFLVEVGDAPALAARLLELAADPDRARRMGERGFERVDEFSSTRMVRQLEELYTRLAVEKGVIPNGVVELPDSNRASRPA